MRAPGIVRSVPVSLPFPVPTALRGWVDCAVDRVATAAADAWEWTMLRAAISQERAQRRGFRAYGANTSMQRPWRTLIGEPFIEIGSESLIAPGAILAAVPYPSDPGHAIIRIGDRTWLGRGLGIVAHYSVEIGDDVWFGPNVYVTDANHAYDDITKPVGLQMAQPRAVRIGSGSWIGTGAVVLAGVTIGEHVAVGANAVVNRDIPSYSVAVGNPARVVRRYEPGEGWIRPPSDRHPQP